MLQTVGGQKEGVTNNTRGTVSRPDGKLPLFVQTRTKLDRRGANSRDSGGIRAAELRPIGVGINEPKQKNEQRSEITDACDHEGRRKGDPKQVVAIRRIAQASLLSEATFNLAAITLPARTGYRSIRGSSSTPSGAMYAGSTSVGPAVYEGAARWQK